jgi:hypothetical protein
VRRGKLCEGSSRYSRRPRAYQKGLCGHTIGRRIRRWAATDAAAYESYRLRRGLLDKSNTASGAWADTAYRSAANETFLTKNSFVGHIHRKKPKGRAMLETMRRANNFRPPRAFSSE